MTYLEFEKPLADLEGKAEELRALARKGEGVDLEKEAAALDRKAEEMLRDLYRQLDPWRKTQVARHPERPHCRDYIEALFTEYTPLAGDRAFGEDHAVMGGLARFKDQPCVVIGHEKGNDTKSRIFHNFGMARPEGYRKAIRLMDVADRFRLPTLRCVVLLRLAVLLHRSHDQGDLPPVRRDNVLHDVQFPLGQLVTREQIE